jgi:hypothetical protein
VFNVKRHAKMGGIGLPDEIGEPEKPEQWASMSVNDERVSVAGPQ